MDDRLHNLIYVIVTVAAFYSFHLSYLKRNIQTREFVSKQCMPDNIPNSTLICVFLV